MIETTENVELLKSVSTLRIGKEVDQTIIPKGSKPTEKKTSSDSKGTKLPDVAKNSCLLSYLNIQGSNKTIQSSLISKSVRRLSLTSFTIFIN